MHIQDAHKYFRVPPFFQATVSSNYVPHNRNFIHHHSDNTDRDNDDHIERHMGRDERSEKIATRHAAAAGA